MKFKANRSSYYFLGTALVHHYWTSGAIQHWHSEFLLEHHHPAGSCHRDGCPGIKPDIRI